MPPRGTNPDMVRIIEGLAGAVTIRMELIIRFDYGSIVPWVRRRHGGLEAVAGPDALILRTPVETHGEDLKTVAEFTVAKNERVPFVLTWFASHEAPPREIDPERALRETETYWRDWAKSCTHDGSVAGGRHALAHHPEGSDLRPDRRNGSCPNDFASRGNRRRPQLGLPLLLAARRDVYALLALLSAGFRDEAKAWREWLLRAIAGSASQLQIMYGVRGERRLTEYELSWLRGYENSRPVRQGNAASGQFQLDVYGEVLDATYHSHKAGLEISEADWRMQVQLLNFLESKWSEPDEGIWEVRGPRQQFTHSKVMAWVAFDRAVKMVEQCRLLGEPSSRSMESVFARQIHREVCENGYNTKQRAFTQAYGSDALDASLLMMPLVGFLPAEDERVRNTIAAIERELMQDGLGPSLPAARKWRRRVARRRGCLPAMLFLAG